MTTAPPRWSGSPEERIIRELFRTKEGGLAPGTDPAEYGRVFETVLVRELQTLARRWADSDIRFARGYVVEDYGSSKFEGASATGSSKVSTTDSPRFDIICYRGDVAWRSYQGLPVALVPATFTYGVIEAKRTLSPGYLPAESSRGMNDQFTRQKAHLEEVGGSVPLVVVGAHFSGNVAEIRQKAAADHVALPGNLSNEGSAAKMAREGELLRAIEILLEKDA